MSGRKRAPQVRRPSARQNAEFPLPLFPEVLRGDGKRKSGRTVPPAAALLPQRTAKSAGARPETDRTRLSEPGGKPSGTPRLRAKGHVRYLGFMTMKGMIISSIEMPPCWNVSL